MTANAPLSISGARSQFASLIERVQVDHQPVYLTRRGHRVAAVIAAEDLDHPIELAEDMQDIRTAAQARDEMRDRGDGPIPWDELKTELGMA